MKTGMDIIITPLAVGEADGLLSTTAGKHSGIVLVFYLLGSPAHWELHTKSELGYASEVSLLCVHHCSSP